MAVSSSCIFPAAYMLAARVWFDAKLSQDSHGLFAVQAADGTVTMTIRALGIGAAGRRCAEVVGLPDGLFE